MGEGAAETQSRTLGGGSFFGSIQGRMERYDAIFTDLQHASPRKLPSHSHELPFFALLIDGSYGERYAHRDAQFGPFTLMYRPAGVPHQDEIGPRGVRFFEIELRPSWRQRALDCSGSLETAHEDCRGGDSLWLAIKLRSEIRNSENTFSLCAESLLAELVASVARMSNERIKSAPAWLARIVDRLRTEFCERLTLDELSREAGVHPVHLSRVFRRCMEEGLGEYVHRLRIREACEQMLHPEITLAEISLATGFADQSHFTRAFRQITGINPSCFRKMISPPRTAQVPVGFHQTKRTPFLEVGSTD